MILLYVFLGTMRWLPSGINMFSSEPVLIKETPIEIEQIRAMGTLITAEFYGEVYADIGEVYSRVIGEYYDNWDEKKDSLTELYTQIERYKQKENDITAIRNLVYIGRGWSKAGTDLNELNEDDFKLLRGKSDTLEISIPKAKIITTNINPWYTENKIPGYEIFIGEDLKTLSDHEVRQVKLLCIEKLEKDAKRAGILDRAEQSANLSLTNFFRLLGYENVIIRMGED